jgi:hypothetical protein
MQYFFVLNSVRMPQHTENFSRPLEMTECQEHTLFAGTKFFMKAKPLVKMSSAADDHQQHGQMTTQLRDLVRSDGRLIVKINADEPNMNRETVRY